MILINAEKNFNRLIISTITKIPNAYMFTLSNLQLPQILRATTLTDL